MISKFTRISNLAGDNNLEQGTSSISPPHIHTLKLISYCSAPQILRKGSYPPNSQNQSLCMEKSPPACTGVRMGDASFSNVAFSFSVNKHCSILSIRFHIYSTSLVISSLNEDSDFFHNQKITNRNKHIGKRKFVFLINNLLDYLGRVVICVNILCFSNHRQKSNWKKVKFAKKLFRNLAFSQ